MKNSRIHRGFPLRGRRAAILCTLVGAFSTAQILLPAFASGASDPAALPEKPGEPGPRTSSVRTGELETKGGLTLRLTTDLGAVRITQIDSGSKPVVRYTVHVETDARGATATHLLNSYIFKARSTAGGVEISGTLPQRAARASNAQVWVQFEIAVPHNYNVEVSTDAGDITTGDIGGTAFLRTQGGYIVAGHIGWPGVREGAHGRPVARLETEGGHIKVLDVTGDLTAFTAGGHINAGNISGDASLHSGGGHIRASQITGRADLETGGGNITVGQAGSFVSVHTGGGQIDFGEVHGSVRAQTGGGGIHVMHVSGPMEMESNGGSICLTDASGALQAATSGGSITAWINPSAPVTRGPVRLDGASQLSSGTGDIIVYLPRNLAVTLDVTVLNGNEHQIEADSGLHLNLQGQANGSGPVHAMAALNGGGAPLKLRTSGGKIRLKYVDAEVALRASLLHEQADRLNKRLAEAGLATVDFRPDMGPAIGNPPDQLQTDSQRNQDQQNNDTDWLESWLNDLERVFRGNISEDPDSFLKRLTYRPPPAYPALAQRAGVHGFVVLQVKVTKEGHVEVQRIVQGEPVLANAAIDAVKRWQGKPAWAKGKPVEVISTVKFDFQLR